MRPGLRWLSGIAAAALVVVCGADATTVKTADHFVTLEVIDFRPNHDEPRYLLDYEYRMKNHATDAEIVQMVLDIFEITPDMVGEEEYAELTAQGLEDVAAGRLGLQWSVEVQALDASGEVLGTSLLQSDCGTRGGESIEHYSGFWLYEDGPVFAADDVAEVVFDTATLEVLPLVLSERDEQRCGALISGDRGRSSR